MKAAAIQLAVKIADSPANIASCERLALQAVQAGARYIALPEFFNTGVAWEPKLAQAIQPVDGPAASFLKDFSARHHVVIGGSFLCRLDDGRVRNRYLCFADGALVGRHDKDLPTMWENAFYEGGDPQDTGVLGTVAGVRVGAAVCWEFMRTGTARRLRGQVDLVIGGSCWWSMPTHYPLAKQLFEPRNADNALAAVRDTARLIGAPVLHAAHCGQITCTMPGLPFGYRGHLEGNAAIIDADGRVLAHRSPRDGEGIVVAEVTPGARPAPAKIPQGFWLRRRGVLPAFAWHHQKLLGRRWYKRHVR